MSGERKDASSCLLSKNMIKKQKMVGWKHTIFIRACEQWFESYMTTHHLVVLNPNPLGCKTLWHAMSWIWAQRYNPNVPKMRGFLFQCNFLRLAVRNPIVSHAIVISQRLSVGSPPSSLARK